MTRPTHRIVLGTAAALLLAACGSTVAPTAQGGAGQSALQQQGLGVPPANGSAAPLAGGTAQGGTGGVGSVGGTGGQAGGAVGTGGQVAGAGSTGAAGSGTTGSGSGAAAGAVGPGVTDTEIRLGIPYCNDCDDANAALGAGGENTGDTKRYYQTALDDVNARGGVKGRKLVAVWHEISVSDNIETSQQAACETFTKDNKVFAIFFRGETTFNCAKKAGIIAVGAAGTGPVYARYPNVFFAPDVRLERLGAVTVRAMVKAGWHKPDTKWPTGKIGLVTWETPEYRYAMQKGWLPALHESGLKETDVRYIAVPQSDKSIADAGAAISSAVLRFREQGIDHVFISDGPAGIFAGTGLTFLFLQNAKSQRYYPRYGFNTNNSPGWPNHPADQEVGMLAVDSGDTETSNDEGIALNPERERCFAIMRKKGLPVGQVQSQNVAVGACEYAWFAEAIIKASRSTLLPDVIAGGESLGTSYRSSWSYGNRFGPGLHDGTDLFRNSRFDETCSCMKYTSKPYRP